MKNTPNTSGRGAEGKASAQTRTDQEVARRRRGRLLAGTRYLLPMFVIGLASACGNSSPAPEEEGSDGGAGTQNAGGSKGGGGSKNNAGAKDAGTNASDASTSKDSGKPNPDPTGTGDQWHKKAGRGEVVDPGKFISTEAGQGRFPLVADGKAASIVVSSKDYKGALRAVNDLRADVKSVTQVEPTIAEDAAPTSAKQVVLVGTLGKAPLIDALVSQGKLDVTGVAGRWETFLIQIVNNPMAGVTQALVVAGSDQRGTIFGTYELSGQMGVSPWYWWDDIPAPRRRALYVLPGRHSQGEPAVKFRGFFVNDENPQTGRWHKAKFGEGLGVVKKPSCDNDAGIGADYCTYKENTYTGGLTHQYWEKVFEVALRLKANYVWPAVWGRQFADDDPENLQTVADYGIVIGTSHEAPMMRGIEEWNIRVDPTKRDSDGNITHTGIDPWGGNGEWAWTRNADALKKYWQEGIDRMVKIGFDGVVTLAMRGTGDLANDETGKIDVLSKVVEAQQKILTDTIKKPLSQIPQVWLLYKEVQTYWDKGMRPQDDVTIIWCDDNWGNMRKLQDPTEKERAGGYGIYYHFDYVGAGRNYKWIDTNLLPNIWEQLNLVYSYGVDRLWIVNVGDMKNEELPLQYFLDYAWNPERWPVERISDWEQQWAEQQFGPSYAKEIANVLREYSKLQSDRKPELTNRKITVDPSVDIEANPGGAVVNSDEAYFAKAADGGVVPPEQRPDIDHNPFSLTSYREMETVVASWNTLADETKRVENLLLTQNPEYKDAYYELVAYEVLASANLYNLRLAQFRNLLFAKQGRASTSATGEAAKAALATDKQMSEYYNKTLADGKWEGWQTQPKIGYGDQDRYGGNAPWQQPEKDNEALEDELFPLVKTLDVSSAAAQLGVAVDGAETATWAGSSAASTPALPTFSPYQSQPPQYIEVFNGGGGSLTFSVDAPTWMTVTLNPNTNTLDATTTQVRAELKVKDWAAAATAKNATVRVRTGGDGGSGKSVDVPVKVESPTLPETFAGFVEANGYVSIEADHYDKLIDSQAISWLRVPDIGRTGAGLMPLPVDAPAQKPAATSNTPHIEYKMFLSNVGGTQDGGSEKEVTVWAYLSPRNNVRRSAAGGATVSKSGDGLKYAVSFDDAALQTVDINRGCDDINLNKPWAWHTSDNVNRTATKHTLSGPGAHTLKFWMVDPTVIVQKIVVDTGTGELRESYFGPPESLRKTEGN